MLSFFFMTSATLLGKRPIEKHDAGDEESKKRKAEEKLTKFTDLLTGASNKIKGPLRERRLSVGGRIGRINRPFAHQRDFCKKMPLKGRSRKLMLHDPGLGKTTTFLLFVASKQTVHYNKVQKTLVSVPAACIDQWYAELVNTIRISASRVVKTNKLSHITESSLQSHDFFIVSKDLIGNAFASCFEWKQMYEQNENNHWVSGWSRKADTELHPLFKTKFSILGIDEVHFLRNEKTNWTQGHQRISQNSETVVGMTATPIINDLNNMIGIANAMDLGSEWCSKKQWFIDKKCQQVNLKVIPEFNRLFTDRVTDEILSLPPITDAFVDYDVALKSDYVEEYNEILRSARRLHWSMVRRNTANMKDHSKLMAYLMHLQQMVVSPILAEHGAKKANSDPRILEMAAEQGSGSLKALRDKLLELGTLGFKRIMVAACHTSLLHVAKYYLELNCPEVGHVIVYEGSLTQKKRSEAIQMFLNEPTTVMLMSISAGGTGLHLVPGSNAVVFWGSRPFSPMQILQTKKRVHRIGQEAEVTVVHLIPKGSVDDAINKIHSDKLTLAEAMVDEKMAPLENEGGRWRTTGRIVDNCKFLNEDGTFPQDEDELPCAGSIPVSGVYGAAASALLAQAASMASEALAAPGLQF
jgi:hypothetical protein